jgi:hypothetical protein
MTRTCHTRARSDADAAHALLIHPTMRAILPLGLLCAALAASGCSSPINETVTDEGGAPDPSSSSSGGSSSGDLGSSSSSSSSSSSGGTSSSSSSGGGGDASAPDSGPKSDAGTDAGPLPDGGINAFTGAGAYVAKLGPSARNQRHNFPANNPPTNPAGSACLTCHGGQQKGTVRFLFGGTIYKDVNGTAPVPMIEVRTREANGTGSSAMTDADGNYYFVRNQAFAPPVQGGARDGTTTNTMTNIINNGDCNSCHAPGGEGRIHVP